VALPVESLHTPYEALQALLLALRHHALHSLVGILEAQHPMPEEIAMELRSADWGMLKRMVEAGMTVGSHSDTHIFLTRESPSDVDDELTCSKRRIEWQLGQPVRHFAYPSGQFDGPAIRAVARAGYEFGYTVCEHADPNAPLLTIPRTVLWENACVDWAGRFSPSLMAAQVSGFFALVSPPCRTDHRLAQAAPHAARDIAPGRVRA
jgi:hypothetical protein